MLAALVRIEGVATHISQTKDESRISGGPQYYLHAVPAHVKEFPRKGVLVRFSCKRPTASPPVHSRPLVMTTSSPARKPVAGRVGHDRIQGVESIGKAIRYWYGLKSGRDFERIDLEAIIHREGHFILIPTAVKMRPPAKRTLPLEKVRSPLSFHHDYQSKLWKNHIEACRQESASDVAWAANQIRRIVAQHRDAEALYVKEEDLLRAAGALSLLGADLSPYVGKGYDCPESHFRFSGLPSYPCPVEIKKRSSRFQYQITRYPKLPRAVVLCVTHDLVNPPDDVDIVELAALAEYLTG